MPTTIRGFLSSARRAPVLTVLVVLAALAMPVTALAVQQVPVSKFAEPVACGCHAPFYQTWSESLHAQALTDPVYQAKVAEANNATKGALGPFCETCHGPVAAMGGLLGKNGANRPAQAASGVTCDFCHQATSTTKPVGNSSFLVTADGVKKAQLKDAKSAYHATASSAFHQTGEFCGMCHDVRHPANGMALESTYSEWKNGPYAKSGIVCQDCHMTPGAGVTKPNPGRAAPFGPERAHVYTMTFVGGNATLGNKALAEERLRAAAALKLTAPEIAEPGSAMKLQADITNVGAGHYLPTGLTEVRRMWLEVVATDAEGKELLREQRVFGTELADKNGKSPVELWEAVKVASDDRIAPGATVTQAYQAKMPSAGAVKVTAALYYRGVPEELGKKAGVEVPVTEMAKTTASIYPSKAAAAAATDEGIPNPPTPNGWLLLGMTALGLGGTMTVLGVGIFAARRR